MKRFVYKVFIFLFPVIVCVICLELLIRKMPNDYKYKNDYLNKNSGKITKLFLGSSHSYYGIDPEFITGVAFNASHISQSINLDFEILKKYHHQWKSLKYIVIPVDYFTLFSRLSTDVEYWRLKNYNLYYDMNLSYRLSNYSELLSVNLWDNLIRIGSYYLTDKSYITCFENGFGNKGKKMDLEKSGVEAAIRHTKKDLPYFQESVKILNDIVTFASEKDIKVVFYTSPGYKSYVSNLNQKQINLTIKTMTELAKDNENCIYINLLSDAVFNHSDYNDADHLNPEGAKKLSIKIDRLLNQSENNNLTKVNQ